MTKKLEELFNLEDREKNIVPKEINEEIVEKAREVRSINESLEAANQIAQGLPQINELNDLNDQELDELADKAEKAYDDLMDLGMNVEVRYSGRIFEVAASMMGHAITAKSNKIEKKLKAIDLQLKKLKIDNDAGIDPNNVINGQGYVITDRNELLKKLGGKA
jgi:hypothetical protein